MTLYILKFNNYLNRVVKKFNTFYNYEEYILGDPIVNINFNPNDGITTEQIINWNPANGNGDYLLAIDDNGDINSRWFIMEAARTRAGQYRLTLRRDLLADFYEDYINAPCFIEKATLSAANPLLFNRENMTYNQIKQSENLLKDETNSAWIVGYIPRDAFQQAQDIELQVPTTQESAAVTVNGITNWELYSFSNLNPNYSNATFYPAAEDITITTTVGGLVGVRNTGGGSTVTDGKADIATDIYGSVDNDYTTLETGISTTPLQVSGTQIGAYSSSTGGVPYPDVLGAITQNYSNVASTIHRNAAALMNSISLTLTTKIKSYDGKVIYDSSTDKAYKIKVVSTQGMIPSNYAVTQGTNIFTTLNNALNKNFYIGSTNVIVNGTPNSSSFLVSAYTTTGYISLDEVTVVSTKVTIPSALSRPHLEDSPYDMFCIPYNAVNIYSGDTKILTTQEGTGTSIAIQIGPAIAGQEGAGNIFDAQLLPYCPLRNIVGVNGNIVVNANTKVNYITTGNDVKVSAMFWCYNSSFNFDIPYEIPVKTTALDKKIETETSFHRLCSPNYNGIFEFDAQKNNGVSVIHVSCTYKPFNPYIHLRPNFGGLYGLDLAKDNRGLICGGDFSLAQISDAWANYELNNKNYENIFNRQISNLNINNSVQREQEMWNIISGTVSGVSSGAIAGGLTGNPYAAAAGAILGGGASLAGGLQDRALNEMLRKEQIDYQRDMYGYQLGNIQAIPQSLSKTSAFAYDNKIFPFIEYYSCTSEEKLALRYKLQWDGMTVMSIGAISQYKQTNNSFIKGTIIRLADLDEDYHIAAEIKNEIQKGVFI